MIVVTGAFGFIGVYLIDELVRQGYEVLATGHRSAAQEYFTARGVQYCNLDVTNDSDFRQLPERGVEAVLHLAGLVPANVRECPPHDYIRVNVLGTLNVLEYCRVHEVRKLISTTSYADLENAWTVSPPIADDAPREFLLTGDHAMYVIAKNAAADSILHYNAAHGLSGSIFRLPPVYGYGPHLAIFVDGEYRKSGFQIFLEKAEAGEPIEVWGDRTLVRDVIYVKDVVQAFVKALGSDQARGIYNISSGKGITLEEQARAMVAVFSSARRSQLVFRTDKPSGIKPYVFDIRKAEHDFNFSPQFDFLEMLKDFKRERDAGNFDDLVRSRIKV